MLGDAKTWAARFRDAFIYAAVLVVLLFGASAVTSEATNQAVEQIREATRQAATAADAQARLTAANACVLQYFDAEARRVGTPECYAAQALPWPFDYDSYVASRP